MSAKEPEGRLKRLKTILEENSVASSAKGPDEATLRWLEHLMEKQNPIEPPKGSSDGVTELFAGQMDFHMPDEERALQREAAVYAGRCPKCGCKPSIIRSADGIYSLHCRFPGRKAEFLDHSCDFPKPEPQKNPHTLIRIWNLSLKLCQG